jgi:hypothetical protein
VIAVPHLALPFTWGVQGHAVENEQDSPADVAACVAATCLCPLGWRPEQIEYGVEEQVFALNLDDAALLAIVQRWEPRANVLSYQLDDEGDLLLRHVQVVLQELT